MLRIFQQLDFTEAEVSTFKGKASCTLLQCSAVFHYVPRKNMLTFALTILYLIIIKYSSEERTKKLLKYLINDKILKKVISV